VASAPLSHHSKESTTIPRHGNAKIPRQKTVEKIPLPWRGAENSKNFWWGGSRNIAGIAASSGRWLSGVKATGRVIGRSGDFAYGCVINQLRRKFRWNFRHPSYGWELEAVDLDNEGPRYNRWLSGAKDTSVPYFIYQKHR